MAISIKLDQILQAVENTEGVGLQVLAADPTEVPAKGVIYSKDVDGYAELFFMDSEGNVTQLSSQGIPAASAADLDAYATKILLDSYATIDIVDGYALTSSLSVYAEKTLLDSYALVGEGGGGGGDLHSDGYLELPALAADATAADDYGTLYVKNTSVINYVKQSEEFNVSPWSNSGILSYSTGQSDPFGGTDAFGLTATSGAGSKQLFQPTLGAFTGEDAVASFYVKKGQFNWVLIQACGGGARSWFDLNTGMPGSNTGADYQDHGLIYEGSGWYRCWMLVTNDSNNNVFLNIVDGDGQFTATGSGSGTDIYVHASQFENSSLVERYVATTTTSLTFNFPSFYYTDVVDGATQIATKGGLVIPALSLDDIYRLAGTTNTRIITVDEGPVVLNASGEEAFKIDGYVGMKPITAPTGLDDRGMVYVKNATNLNYVLQSEEFDQSPWSNSNILSYSTGQDDPLGGTDAFGITVTTASNSKTLSQNTSAPIGGTTMTLSLYAKAGNMSWIVFQNQGGSARTWFDISNGVLGNTTGTAISRTITAVDGAPGWYRCAVTVANTSTNLIFYLVDSNGAFTVAGSGSGIDFYLHGAQFEPSSEATLYVENVATQTPQRRELYFVNNEDTHLQVTDDGALNIDISSYLTSSDLTPYAEKTLLDSYATADVVDGYALDSDLDVYAEQVLLDSYAPLSFLDDYATGESITVQNGFENQTDSTLSFDDGTLTLTIAPAVSSFSFWDGETKYTKNSSEDRVITDVEGLHFIYYDGGELQHTTTFSTNIINTYAYVAAIYWDATNNKGILVGDERHGREMDAATHSWAHNVFGTLYDSGLALGDISADGTGDDFTDAYCSVSDGIIRDEDIIHSIVDESPQILSPISQIPLYYRLGSNGDWRKIDATNFPVTTTGTGRAAWNEDTGSTWQLTEVTNNDFVLTHIVATNDIINPIIGIVGQNEYASAAAARIGAVSEVNQLALGSLGSLFVEFLPIGTLIYKTSNGFNNDVQSKVVSTDEGEDYIDFRLSGIGSGSGTTTSDHGSLSGLADDDHIQYFNTTRGDARYAQLDQSDLIDGYLPLVDQVSDPTEMDDYGMLYSKEVGDGYVELHYLDNYGLVTVVTGSENANSLPQAPSSHDDEFRGAGQGDLNSKWSWEGAGAPTSSETWGIDKGSLWVQLQSDTGSVGNWSSDVHALMQSVPSSGDWSIEAKFRGMVYTGSGRFGILVRGSDLDDSVTLNVNNSNGDLDAGMNRINSGTFNGVASDTNYRLATRYSHDTYFRLDFDSATPSLTGYFSTDGITWYDFLGSNSYTLPWTATAMGLYFWSLQSSTQRVNVSCEWFRLIT